MVVQTRPTKTRMKVNSLNTLELRAESLD